MSFTELMAEFGETYKVDGLVPDSDGGVSVGIDDFVVSFFCEPSGERLLVFSELAMECRAQDDFILKRLLEANYLFLQTSGATLSANPDNGHVALCRTEPLEWMTVDRLSKLVDGFVNDLSVWKGLIEGCQAIEGDLEGAREREALGAQQLLSGEFTRI